MPNSLAFLCGEPGHNDGSGNEIWDNDEDCRPEVDAASNRKSSYTGHVGGVGDVCQPTLPAVWQVAAADFDKPFFGTAHLACILTHCANALAAGKLFRVKEGELYHGAKNYPIPMVRHERRRGDELLRQCV